MRVKDMMTNVLRHKAKNTKGVRPSVIDSFIPESKQEHDIELTEKQISMFFNNWGNDLDELPLSFQADIMRLGRPRNFSLHEKIIDFEEQSQNMYLIVEGNAVLFKNEYSYEKFNKQLETVTV